MTGNVLIGCSGWMYAQWRGPVYPVGLPQRRWFEWYAARLPTVELNATFHRLPSAGAIATWRRSAPDGFMFAAKLGAFGSHRKKLIDPGDWLPLHVERISGLGEHTGPTLVQLPPTLHRDTGRLDAFLAAAPDTMRWAVECRHRSWLHDDVYEVLARHGAALCIHDLLARHPRVITTDWTYLRFHGPHALERPYQGPYPRGRLTMQAEWIGELARNGTDVYCYFNNDGQGHAFHDAGVLRSMVLTSMEPTSMLPPRIDGGADAGKNLDRGTDRSSTGST